MTAPTHQGRALKVNKAALACLGLSLFAVACGGPSPDEESTSSSTTNVAHKNLASALIQHGNWVSSIQQDPSEFIALASSQRAALIALHKNDFKAALSQAGISEALRIRAESELARLHHRLARVSRLTWATIAAEYSSRTGNTAPEKIQEFARLAQHSGWWSTSPSVLELSKASQAIQGDTERLSSQALIDQAQRPIDTIDGKIKIYIPLTHQGLVRAGCGR